ncbi:MAG: WYL domain-containing protein, partial [Mycobacterium sp.]
LVGHDRDRGATRVFRLSRIGEEVTPIGPAGAVTRPEGVDLRMIVAEAVGEAPSGVQAQVWLADGRATALRRAGTSLGPRQLAGRDGEVIELDVGSTDRLARDIAGYGADAVVLEPSSLREEVLRRLRGCAGDGEEGRI